MKHHTIIALALLMSVGTIASAADLQMNAAVAEESQTVAPGTYSVVRVVNTLPSREYTLEARVEAHQVPVISLDDARQKVQQARAQQLQLNAAFAQDTECNALDAATVALLAAADESGVSSLRTKAEAARAAAVGHTCPGLVLADAAIARSERRFDMHIVIGGGQFATVTAFRVEPDGRKTQVTRKVFDAGKLGDIRLHAVLGLAPNRDQNWFTKQNDAGKFVVTSEVDRDAFDTLGALIFTWLPTQDTTGWSQVLGFKKGAYSGSFTVGVGLESSEPIYLAGYALNFTESFGIVAGFAGYNQKRLKGIYKGDGSDILDAALQPDQLVDETFDASWFAGITLRR